MSKIIPFKPKFRSESQAIDWNIRQTRLRLARNQGPCSWSVCRDPEALSKCSCGARMCNYCTGWHLKTHGL